MAREKANYRETLAFLNEQGYPMLIPFKDVMTILGICRPTLVKLIKTDKLTAVCEKVPIGSLANFLCG